MAVRSKKKKKTRLLMEGTVCGIGLISDSWKTKQDKYRELRAGIKHQYLDYKVNQVNVVFDLIASRIPPKPEERFQRTFNRKIRRKDAISNTEKSEMNHTTKR